MTQTTFLKNRPVTRRLIKDAMRGFDQEFPHAALFPRDHTTSWLDDRKYKYAVQYACRLYPPKYIIHLVTGLHLSDFNGGEQTNKHFRAHGFEVGDKRTLEEKYLR